MSFSSDDLKKKLTPLQYKVTQEDGTEPPFQNEYWNNKADGIYVDIVSGEPLFSSTDKYDSGTGWPSFTRPISKDNIYEKVDRKFFMKRTEVRSQKADCHLGHVFDDGPAPTGLRYCMNSAALKFVPVSEMKNQGYEKYLYLFPEASELETAILAGGCFWGVQELMRKQKGVVRSEVGYIGGDETKTTYEEIKKGHTGQAEAVRIVFDPKQTSFKDLLLYFFKIHDPTTINQQGNDIGTQYRSEIFYLNETQRAEAEEVIKRVDLSKKWGAPVVTKLSKASTFSRGEEYHQDYLQKHPNGYNCHFPRDIDF